MCTSLEVEEALRSAQDVLAFMRHNIDPSGEGGAIEMDAEEGYAETLCALLNDAEVRVGNALDAIELSK